MPVSVEWDNEAKNVLRYDLGGRWTWDEFFKAFNDGKDLMAEVTHVVHFIVNPLDTVSNGYLPPGALTHAHNISRAAPPNAGATVLVGGGPFLKAMYTVGQRLYPRVSNQYKIVDSLETARAELAKLEMT